jgi:hypothetical protein
MHAIRYTIFIATVSLASCVNLSDKAASVQVHTQLSSTLDKCKKLGPVLAKASVLAPDGELQAKLRDMAADLGGDTVVFLHIDRTLTEERLQGIAYKCY